jgi:hypothetical protein
VARWPPLDHLWGWPGVVRSHPQRPLGVARGHPHRLGVVGPPLAFLFFFLNIFLKKYKYIYLINYNFEMVYKFYTVCL